MRAAEILRPVEGGVELDIMVTPNARVAEVGEVDPWRKRLTVKVPAVPAEGRANRAVVDLLSELFMTKVVIVRGHTDRHKTVLIPLAADLARDRLEAP
jgi:uncharacterized protein